MRRGASGGQPGRGVEKENVVVSFMNRDAKKIAKCRPVHLDRQFVVTDDHLCNQYSLPLHPRPAMLPDQCLASLHRSFDRHIFGYGVVIKDAERISEHFGETGNDEMFQLERR